METDDELVARVRAMSPAEQAKWIEENHGLLDLLMGEWQVEIGADDSEQ